MANPVVAAQIGSGTVPFTYGILPPEQRGTESEGQGIRTGSQVMVGNPEDITSACCWATSGVTVGAVTPVKLIGPDTNPLPRCRMIGIENNTPNSTLFITNVPNSVEALTSQGFVIEHGSGGAGPAGDHFEVPLLHNNEIWALAETGTIDVRLIIW